MQGVNLLPGNRRATQARRLRARWWIASVACYVMLLGAAYVACLASIGSAADDISTALLRATTRIEELDHSVATLRPQLIELNTRLNVARAVGNQPDWSLLLSILSRTVDERIVLTSAKLDAATTTEQRTLAATPSKSTSRPAANQPSALSLNLLGLANSQSAVNQFVLRLEQLGLFERVDLRQSTRQTTASKEVTMFRIECLLQTSGTASEEKSR